MLTAANIVAFVASSDLDRSRRFYEEMLGLRLVDQGPGEIVFDARGAPLRITLDGALAPADHTVLGWQVADVRATARDLGSRGLRLERFDGLEQDAEGIWTHPDGAHVAWFRDPDHNLLSITET